nr:type VI secretion system baseplate subunit TssG [uncultured Moellerella sp.]
MSKPYSETLNLTTLLLRWKNELKNSSSSKVPALVMPQNIKPFKALNFEQRKENNIPVLMGTDGCLPREMSLSGITSELEKGNNSITDFFAIFEKYYLELLYKCQFKYNWSLLYEQQSMLKKTSKLSLLLNSLCRKTTDKKQYQSLYYRGISFFSPSNKRLTNLKMWLEHYFNTPINLQYAEPKQQSLESQDVTKLSENNNILGVNTLLGNKCSLYGDRIDILIDVTSLAAYHDWREDSERINLMREACHFYYKMEAKFNIKLRVPSCIIAEDSVKNRSNENMQLGISAFLGVAKNMKVEILL